MLAAPFMQSFYSTSLLAAVLSPRGHRDNRDSKSIVISMLTEEVHLLPRGQLWMLVGTTATHVY